MQAATVAKRKPRSVRPNGRSAQNSRNTESPMASCPISTPTLKAASPGRILGPSMARRSRKEKDRPKPCTSPMAVVTKIRERPPRPKREDRPATKIEAACMCRVSTQTTGNFLTAAALQQRLARIDVLGSLGRWLSEPANAKRLGDYVAALLPRIASSLPAQQIGESVGRLTQQALGAGGSGRSGAAGNLGRRPPVAWLEHGRCLVEHDLFGKPASALPDHAHLATYIVTENHKECRTVAEYHRTRAELMRLPKLTFANPQEQKTLGGLSPGAITQLQWRDR